MLDFKIKVFHSAATSLSFTRAAEENLITQPAVSKLVRQLEQQLGQPLFERNGSKLKLTPAGSVLKSHVDNAIAIEKQLQFDFGVIRNEHSGHFTLGASTTIAQYIIPKILLRFNANNPKLELKLISGNTQEIERATLEKAVDLGIVEGVSHRSGLRYLPFMEDNLTVVCHRNHPLFSRSSITLEMLKYQPIILRERGSGTLEVIEHALRKVGIRLSDLNVKLYIGSTESIKNALESGSCIAIISEHSFRNEASASLIKALPLEGVEFKRQLAFVLPQSGATGIAEAFIQFARFNL